MERGVQGTAHLGLRMSAFVIDLVIVFLTLLIVNAVVFPKEFLEMSEQEVEALLATQPEFYAMMVLLLIVYNVVMYGYFVYFQYSHKQTLGMRVMKISVISDTNVTKRQFLGKILLRNAQLLIFLPQAPIHWIGIAIDSLYVFMNKEFRRGVEVLSGTRVVTTSSMPAYIEGEQV